MDNSILLIVIGSTTVFIGIIVWKLIWFIKKVDSAQAPEDSD